MYTSEHRTGRGAVRQVGAPLGHRARQQSRGLARRGAAPGRRARERGVPGSRAAAVAAAAAAVAGRRGAGGRFAGRLVVGGAGGRLVQRGGGQRAEYAGRRRRLRLRGACAAPARSDPAHGPAPRRATASRRSVRPPLHLGPSSLPSGPHHAAATRPM